jgi:hypothetical protein
MRPHDLEMEISMRPKIRKEKLLVDVKKECGKLTKKLILLVHGESSDLNEWRGWCQEVHAALPEDLKQRRRMLKKRKREEEAKKP